MSRLLWPTELVAHMVGRVGVEPTVFLMWGIYSPLPSPLGIPTHIYCVFTTQINPQIYFPTTVDVVSIRNHIPTQVVSPFRRFVLVDLRLTSALLTPYRRSSGTTPSDSTFSLRIYLYSKLKSFDPGSRTTALLLWREMNCVACKD